MRDLSIARNQGHFEPANNYQGYIVLHSGTIEYQDNSIWRRSRLDLFDGRKWQFYRIFGRFELCSSQFDREQLTLLMHFPVIGECLGWRTTDFEELYGDLGQWSMTKELAREVSGFYLSSPCEVWWIAESVLNMARSRADGTTSSWLLYFRNFTNFHTVSYIIWTPLWTKCASAAAILSNISADVQNIFS